MRSSLKQWVVLPDALWPELAALFHPAGYDRAEHLVLPGLLRFCYRMLMTESGISRSSKRPRGHLRRRALFVRAWVACPLLSLAR